MAQIKEVNVQRYGNITNAIVNIFAWHFKWDYCSNDEDTKLQ